MEYSSRVLEIIKEKIQLIENSFLNKSSNSNMIIIRIISNMIQNQYKKGPAESMLFSHVQSTILSLNIG